MDLYKVEKTKDEFGFKDVIEVQLLHNENPHYSNIAYFSVKRLFRIKVLNYSMHGFLTGFQYFYSLEPSMTDEEIEKKIEEIKHEMDVGIERGMEFLKNLDENMNYNEYISLMQSHIYDEKT